MWLKYFTTLTSFVLFLLAQLSQAEVTDKQICEAQYSEGFCFYSYVQNKVLLDSAVRRFLERPSLNEEMDYSKSINELNHFLKKNGLLKDQKELMDRRVRQNTTYRNPVDEALKSLQIAVNLTEDSVEKILEKFFFPIDYEVKIHESDNVDATNYILPESLLGQKLKILQEGGHELDGCAMAKDAISELMKLKRTLGNESATLDIRKYSTAEVEEFVSNTWLYLTGKIEDKKIIDIFEPHFDVHKSLKRHASTLIQLPKPVFIPGDRFREIYYWDSYPIIRGLAVSGNVDDMINLVYNYFYFIDTIGFIPNGAREYYLDRSQPPLFANSVAVLYSYLKSTEKHEMAKTIAEQALPRLLKEYLGFWMNPKTGHIVHLKPEPDTKISASTPTQNVIQRLIQGEPILNRYYSHLTAPRPESFLDDHQLILDSQKDTVKATLDDGFDAGEMMRAIRAAAESGHDFSSRWNRKYVEGSKELPKNKFEFFKDLDTTNIVPIDLNTFLLSIERVISQLLYEVLDKSVNADELKRMFYSIHSHRQESIDKFLRDNDVHVDYDLVKKQPSKVLSAASIHYYAYSSKPIPPKIDQVLLKRGGYATTEHHTNEQWDYPNGWAPLQGMPMGHIGEKWVDLYGADKSHICAGLPFVKNAQAFHQSQKTNNKSGLFVEKYNVEDTQVLATGGEYVLQRGFGWTNGVVAEVFTMCYGPEKTIRISSSI